MSAPAIRLCPLCSRPASRDHDCPRRHPAVRVTRLPTPIVDAIARAWAEHDPTADRATEALDALDAAAEALRNAGLALVREPGARGSLRLQGAEEAVLRATDTLRAACGVGL